jgi:hypothetical protein
MKTKGVCLGKKIGVFLLVACFAFLPMHSNLSLAADKPVTGPSTERENGSARDTTPKPAETPADQSARGGDAGPGATKDLKSKKWWWIGGGAVAVIAVVALAAGGGGGGGGGGGSTPVHP